MSTAAADYDSTELELFRDNIRRFASEAIEPHYEQWEKDEMWPRELWNAIGEAGLLCVDIPEQYGGFGASTRFSFAILEELSRAGYGALFGCVGMQSDILAHYILNMGSDEQKAEYLPKMASGECVAALGMTEPGGGSDLQAVRTFARQDGDDFVINGAKTFISNGHHADIIILVARTDREAKAAHGISLIIVPTDTPGFSVGRNLSKMGCHSADTVELFFEDVRVPQGNLLGELNQGFIATQVELPRERLTVAAGAVAACEGVLEWTVDYVREREAFGRRVADFQNTQFKLAEYATDTRVHRAFYEECVDKCLRGELDSATASMAKLACTEAQGRVVDGCLQLFGGYGYMTEYPVSRAYVDARIQRIYAGTNEIMKLIIARDLLKG
ncbi:MAG: acyl-CoA dehydrogenase family protein [Gammaproteobacteria bacterium]